MLALTFAATVQFGVLGSLHPAAVEVRPAGHTLLVVETNGKKEILGGQKTKILIGPAIVTGPHGEAVKFRLGIPGGMHHEYFGTLEVTRVNGELIAVVEMDLEAAVASIVSAEGSTSVPFEARKAQAIVTRSYLLAVHDRHVGFDFCDSDHCQMMHGLAPADPAALQAAEETRGQVIVYQGNVVPAAYSADCGGHTRTAAEAGWMVEHYPYFEVSCPRVGHASGHRVGLCQMGALELARHGVGYRAIVTHYFPQTTIEAATFISDKGGRAKTLARGKSARPESREPAHAASSWEKARAAALLAASTRPAARQTLQ